MKFNVIRIGSRDFVDIQDLNASYYNMTLKNSDLNRETLATVISGNNFITSKFAEQQPKEHVIYEVSVPDAIFAKEISRVFKANKKLLPKKPGEEIYVMDQETYTDEKYFTAQQIEQLQRLVDTQNGYLKKIFEEAIKNISITVEQPLEQPKKSKPSAKS
ncbi:MAG: hypothetical protein K2N64_07610 [Anaeroplasmataceae bacterium]|nr:hypothetical protein [Anaeroplasmataceae bacterium]